MNLSDLNTPVPVYVTRASAHGATGSYMVPAWMFLSAGLLLTLNIVLWSGIGLFEAVQFIVR